MSRHHQFEVQLENLRHEGEVAAKYIYTEMAIQHAASKSKKLLSRLNRTPTFWIACGAAFQAAAYIALGRIFDLHSKYNLCALLDSMKQNLSLFQREALAARKRQGRAADPPWLADYLAKAYYPTTRDVGRLRETVDRYRAIYERAIKPARNKYLAHREKEERAEVQALFARGKVCELWRLTTFLLQLHTSLWELFHNGWRPVIRPTRYSVKEIFDAKHQRSQPHEMIVREVKQLMSFIENATPNLSIERPTTANAVVGPSRRT